MTRWAGLWFGERLKVTAACHHKIFSSDHSVRLTFTTLLLNTLSLCIYLFIYSYRASSFIVIIIFLQPTFSPMTEGHCPCRCDRRSDTLTGQLRPFPQDYSTWPLLHRFTAQPRASSCQRGAPAGHTSDLQINFRINDKLLPHPLRRAHTHKGTPAIGAHPLSGSSCGSRDKAVASLQAAVLIIHRRSRGGRAVRNGGGAQALNFTPSSNNAK